MSTASDSLIAKIQKLLALARDMRGNENEAAVAMSKVQELLAAHNLNMAELELAAPRSTDTLKARVKTPVDGSAMYEYQRSLMRVIAKTHFCMYFTGETKRESFGKTRTVRQHVLLGSEVNILASRLLYTYLVETFDRLLPYTGMEKRGRDALAWLLGCSERMQERLLASHEAQLREAGSSAPAHGGQQLALVDVFQTEEDLNKDACYGCEPGTTTRKRLESEARTREMDRLTQEYVAQGYDRHDAWYLARGREIPAPIAFKGDRTETAAQRARREQADQRANDRYWQRKERHADREAQRRSSTAYYAGRSEAENIRLNKQVDHNKVKGIR